MTRIVSYPKLDLILVDEKQYPIDSDTIIKILHRHNLGELKSFNPIKAGLINPAFLINDSYVLRIDKSEHLKNVPGHETRFEREAFLYKLLPQKGVPTPTCLGFDSSGEIIPGEIHNCFLHQRKFLI